MIELQVGERRALITGIGGQDGSLLAEHLLDLGYEVLGTVRRPIEDYPTLKPILDRLTVEHADPLEPATIRGLLDERRPHEVYNLAAPSFVPRSWDEPTRTAEVAAVSVTVLLEAIRTVDPGIRFYQASSSEIFGDPDASPQDESSPISPVTPYGVAKAYGHFITRSYRRRYGLHASAGVLYNHESPRRPPQYVTRKVTAAAAAISLGAQNELLLGDLDARRDWGYAPDYVRAMRLILQHDTPGEYVVASGVGHSVRELVEHAFARVGLDWRKHVRLDERLRRGVAELHNLVGNPAKARTDLGWSPTLSFEQLVHTLVDHELARLSSRPA